MLNYEYTSAFKKDYKRVSKQGKDIGLLVAVMNDLIDEKPLPPRNKDHALLGNYIGYRECHIQPDFLLVYKIKNGMIVFSRTGSHSELDL
ncbi:MAG: type II toxin-antitoxin system YafQ family toxin [Clostridiales bacterium]|jgi:mRNA interferase YafQ|nr:type II toxin-antitoxin system YafQ family toxin [Clostridiales bacterium]